MARLSKSRQFSVYDDNSTPTTDSIDDDLKARDAIEDAAEVEEDLSLPAEKKSEEVGGQDHNEDDADDERRDSTLTATSISSFPDSIIDSYTDNDWTVSKYTPFTPPIIRPTFRRPESVRAMQLSSPRQSMLGHSRSRSATPKSLRSVKARGSPRPRSRISEESSVQQEDGEKKQYPLVLLHVTLLPVNLQWSMESMQDLLPPNVLENLQFLRSKISDIVVQRGVLIPHPREQYELLEEGLLEALELKDERITKCGHYRSAASEGSLSFAAGSEQDSDSGVGSSLDGSDGELCATCERHIKTSTSAIGTGTRKWSVKVFAANGLMRSSAWAAAWSEMERVDVEILPWIGEDMRRKLNERREEEEDKERERHEDEEARIRLIVEQQVRFAYEGMKRLDEVERTRLSGDGSTELEMMKASPDPTGLEPLRMDYLGDAQPCSSSKDLPPIYRTSQIPLSVLLKNYIYLLAQERRNLVVSFLGFVALFFAMRLGRATDRIGPQALGEVGVPNELLINPPSPLANVSDHVFAEIENPGSNEALMEMTSLGSDTVPE